MVNIVKRNIIFVENGENWGTVSPLAEAVSIEGNIATTDKGRTYDLNETVWRCVSYDNDMQVEVNHYKIIEVQLPEFLSASEWILRHIEYKYLWGAGVDPRWDENVQRALLSLDAHVVFDIVPLIKTYYKGAFRSNFRKGLAEQIMAWVTADPSDRKYDMPLSRRQMTFVETPSWKWDRVASSLYRLRSMFGVQSSMLD
jgi:hypothetical protein